MLCWWWVWQGCGSDSVGGCNDGCRGCSDGGEWQGAVVVVLIAVVVVHEIKNLRGACSSLSSIFQNLTC